MHEDVGRGSEWKISYVEVVFGKIIVDVVHAKLRGSVVRLGRVASTAWSRSSTVI